MRPIQSVAILGTGAMGGMYASLFAKSGLATVCVAGDARGKRLAAEGIVVNDNPVAVKVFDPQQPGAAPSADLVLVAVKHHQLPQALDDVAPLVSAGTTFISILNGLDSEDMIAAKFPQSTVLHCIALAMDAARDGNQIRYKNPGRLVFGPVPANAALKDKVSSVQQAFDVAGMAWETPADMQRELWFKFMINVGINQASGLLGATYSAFQEAGSAREMMNSLMREVIAVSVPAGVALNEQDLARWHQVLANQSPVGKTSMLQDIEAGRPTELAIFADKVIALGEQYDVPTPSNRAVAHFIQVITAPSSG